MAPLRPLEPHLKKNPKIKLFIQFFIFAYTFCRVALYHKKNYCNLGHVSLPILTNIVIDILLGINGNGHFVWL